MVQFRKVFWVGLVWLWSTTVFAESWQTLEQPQYQLIFPTGLETEARRVAQHLDRYLTEQFAEMPVRQPPKRFPIVLFTDDHRSNGNVGLPPRRSHWFNRPAPLSGLEWFEVLAVHEGKHIVQYNQWYDHPTGQGLYLIFGDMGIAMFSGLFVPSWFYEGDAVVAETDATQGGRGRIAAFDLWLRGHALSDTPYAYDRATLGTHFDDRPYLSPYDLGYGLMREIYSEIGTEGVDAALARTGRWPTLSFPQAVSSLSGESIEKHHLDAMKVLRKEIPLSYSELDALTAPSESQWQSLYPIAADDDGIAALQVDVRKGTHLVGVSAESTAHLVKLPEAVRGTFTSGMKSRGIAQANGHYCWLAEAPHPTDRFRAYTHLDCWSESQGAYRWQSFTKLSQIGLSEAGLLAHEFDAKRQSRLLFYPWNSTKPSLSWQLPKRSLAYDIQPSQGGGWVFVLQHDNGQSIHHLNAALTEMTLLKTAREETLRAPSLTNNWLLFVSDASGVDALHAISRLNGVEYQLTSPQLGHYYPVVDAAQQRIVLANYTPKGQHLVSLPFTDPVAAPKHWQPRPRIITAPPVADSGMTDSTKSYEIEPYSRWQNLWNPHSWLVLFDGQSLNAGVTSTDVFHSVTLNPNVTWSFPNQQVSATLNAQVWLDSGYQLNGSVSQSVSTSGDAQTDASLQLARPWQTVGWSDYRLWQPMVQWLKVGEAQAVTAGLVHQRATAAPYQAIVNAKGWQAHVHGVQRLDQAATTGFVSVTAQTPWLGSRLAAQGQLSWQYQQQDAVSLIPSTSLLPIETVADAATHSQRLEADLRWNLGPVGKSFSPWLYWRNTEVAGLVRQQWQDTGAQDLWLGARLQPTLNLFRNEYFRFAPQLEAYVAPETGDTRWQLGFALSGL